MHELSIAQALVDELARAVRREKAARAVKVFVRVGTLSGVDPRALRFAFTVAKESEKSTEHARLSLRTVKARRICGACGSILKRNLSVLTCSECGSDALSLEGGRDLVIESVELET